MIQNHISYDNEQLTKLIRKMSKNIRKFINECCLSFLSLLWFEKALAFEILFLKMGKKQSHISQP